ncbi:MAG: hypothetical protein LBC47_01660 [Tannerella sp.]|jgi:hypothetical protein|nr:hypothetical protein [Tannerella sp.]
MIKKFYFEKVLALFVLISALSCNRFDEERVVRITPSSLQMHVGETASITIKISPEPVYAILAGMSKPGIIEIIDSNKEMDKTVKAIGVGEMIFFIEYEGKRAECKITVKE